MMPLDKFITEYVAPKEKMESDRDNPTMLYLCGMVHAFALLTDNLSESNKAHKLSFEYLKRYNQG